MNRLRSIPYAVLTVSLLAAGGASAQSMSTIDQREAEQQDRIDAGRRDGSLTRSEAYRLEQGERRIDRYESRARADGVVSPGERQRLDSMLDRESHQINRERNDGQRADGRDNGNHEGWGRGNHYGWNQAEGSRNGWNHSAQGNNGRYDGDRDHGSWSHNGQPTTPGTTSPSHTGWNGSWNGNGQGTGQTNGQYNGQHAWTHQPNPTGTPTPTTASGQGNAWTHGATRTASAPQATSYTHGARMMPTSAPAATGATPRAARSTSWTGRH